jgi:hypothetical protein
MWGGPLVRAGPPGPAARPHLCQQQADVGVGCGPGGPPHELSCCWISSAASAICCGVWPIKHSNEFVAARQELILVDAGIWTLGSSQIIELRARSRKKMRNAAERWCGPPSRPLRYTGLIHLSKEKFSQVDLLRCSADHNGAEIVVGGHLANVGQ